MVCSRGRANDMPTRCTLTTCTGAQNHEKSKIGQAGYVEYKSGVWNYLGLSVGPVNPGSLRCQCGTLMSDPDHPHTCVHLSGARIGRHDICENAWYRGMQRTGMSVSKQPKNRHLQMQGSSPLPGSQGYGNRGDLLGVSLTRMVELDVTFVHTTGTAGRTQGAHKEAGKSVRIREGTKRKHHAKAGTSGYTYATLAHDTHGRLGDVAKEQIRILADEACCHSSVSRSTFIRNLKTELSVATVKGNTLVFQACISQLARKTGKAFQKGATCPHAEVG